MKKVSKMFALGLALAMTFGMTVSAAPSSSTTITEMPAGTEMKDIGISADTLTKNPEVTNMQVSVGTLSAQEETTLKAQAETSFNAVTTVSPASEIKVAEGVTASLEIKGQVEPKVMKAVNQVAEKAANLLNLGADKGKEVATTTVKAAIDIDLKVTGDNKANVLAGNANGIEVAFKTGIRFASDKEYLVLHQKEDGSWEAVPAKFGDDGTVVATFKTLSPVVVVEVGLKEKAEEPAKDEGNSGNNNSSTPATTTAPTSPRTGETLPVAGLMAVICLAGAVVCAKRVRYNK